MDPQAFPVPVPTINEIFNTLSPELALRLFGELSETDRQFYRTIVVSLAQINRLRPVFLDRKPKPERHLWMQRALTKKSSAELAAHVLQMWLVKCHPALLCRFLDALGIAHDPDGTVEHLPSSPGRDALEKAADDLLSGDEPDLAKIYLISFCSLNPGLWPELDEIVANRFAQNNRGLPTEPATAITAEVRSGGPCPED
jgi:hypothetical protein